MVDHRSFFRIFWKNLKPLGQLTSDKQIGHHGRIALLIVVSLGLLFYLVHFHTLTETAFLSIPVLYTESDMHTFWESSQRLLEGDLLGRNAYHFYSKWMQELASQET